MLKKPSNVTSVRVIIKDYRCYLTLILPSEDRDGKEKSPSPSGIQELCHLDCWLDHVQPSPFLTQDLDFGGVCRGGQPEELAPTTQVLKV